MHISKLELVVALAGCFPDVLEAMIFDGDRRTGDWLR